MKKVCLTLCCGLALAMASCSSSHHRAHGGCPDGAQLAQCPDGHAGCDGRHHGGSGGGPQVACPDTHATLGEWNTPFTFNFEVTGNTHSTLSVDSKNQVTGVRVVECRPVDCRPAGCTHATPCKDENECRNKPH